ncbi:ParB/RepB/Spo0J family partition protein [Anaerotignum faecicola]
MKSSARKIQLASYDDLFKNDEERLADTQERIQMLSPEKMQPFPNHPFKVVDDDKMMDMVESIKEYGVLVPIIVRPVENGNYEIVSGHRRHHAAVLAGQEEIPAIVREMDEDAAVLVMVDSNLQRENILPSEKAFAYRMKLEAMKRQAGRPKENATQIGQDFMRGKYSVEILSEQVNESRNQIQRYIRLTHLIPDILEMVDNKNIAFNAAVEISYLSEKEQELLHDNMDVNECSPSLSQAKRLKKYSQEGKLTEDVIDAIMTEEKETDTKLVLKGDTIKKYFPKEYTPMQMQQVITKLLENWYRKRTQEKER